jgi:hypothetical protein
MLRKFSSRAGLLLSVGSAALLASGAAWADAGAVPATDLESPDYHLTGSLSRTLSGTMVESAASLGSRQEFRLTTVSNDLRLRLGESFGDPLLGDNSFGLDRPRATYRYTWLSLRDWDFKVGLSATLDQFGPFFRTGASSAATGPWPRFGSLPLMHLSSTGRLSDNWLLTLNADGLRTARGQALDLDLRVDYSLTRQFALYGGYRLTDTGGEAQDVYGTGPSNSANFGVRFRF